MPTINEYQQYSELALAAYANALALGRGNVTNYINSDMSTPQAQRFDQTWQVLAQQDLTDGFSAVLFERVNESGTPTGEKVLGIRGTEASHWGIDYLVDVVNIAALGTNVGMAQYNSLESFYQSLIAQGKLTNAERITVTGHSLGGFLAQAFTAKHDPVVSATYTYNSPGFSVVPGLLTNVGTQLLELFGITDASIPSSKIFNIRAVDGLSLTAGLGQMIGSVQPTFIESGDAIHNHSIVTLTDSLALYNLYAKLDPNLDMSQIDALFRAASNRIDNSLEKGLQSLVKLFQNQAPVLSTRDAYYTALIGLRDSLGTAPLPAHSYVVVPFTTVDASVALKDTPSGLAYRYALEQLNPFAIVTNTSLYAAHNTDHHLDLYDKNTGEGAMTEQYLKDRAAFLTEVIKANVTDKEFFAGGIRIPGDVDYQDATTAYKFVGGDIFVLENKQILFGGNDSEAINGGSKADHLYGGGGVDIIHGNEGNDYIEGNAGNDWLYGDAGEDRLFGGDGSDDLRGGDNNDTLLGGKLGDFLTGGKGNDILEGGEGIDTYYYAEGDGFDIIRDADGNGQISYKGAILTLQGATKLSDTLYETANGLTKLTVVGDANSQAGATLLIDEAIRVEHFHDGDFGIQLQGNPQQTPVQTGVHLTGSLDRETLMGTDANDILEGGALENLIYGRAGDDRIYLNHEVAIQAVDSQPEGYVVSEPGEDQSALPEVGKGGYGDDLIVGDFRNDDLIGGPGSDVLVGGAGDDWLLGDSEFLVGTPGTPLETYRYSRTFRLPDKSNIFRIPFGWDQNEPIQTENGIVPADPQFLEFDRMFDASTSADDILLGGAGQDRIAGELGVDVIDGGIGDDIISGGEGNDIIYGGDGNDQITGEENALVQLTNGDIVNPLGNDYIDGGAGNDEIAGDAGDDEIYGGTGNDVILGDTRFFDPESKGNDYLDGEEGDDIIFGQGGNDDIFGGDGADQLHGDGPEELTANQGDDYLDGEAGDDYLNGDGGKDQLFGGDGNDELHGGKGDDYLDGEADKDVLLGEEGDDIIFGGAGDDQLRGGEGDDTLDGGEGHDTLLGDAGNDILDGGAGDDSLWGDADDDKLSGGAGNNQLDGGDGNDTLISSGGNDILRGGAGNDQYIVSAGIVRIDDTSGIDTLILNNIFSVGGIALAPVQVGGGVTLGLVAGNTIILRVDNSSINTIQLGDGTTISYADLVAIYNTNNQILLGNEDNGYLVGGKDTNDTLQGGKGNDLLIGGGGNDTFVFNAGDGKDVLREDPNGNVTLKFGPGVAGVQISALNACALAMDMVLSYGNQGDSILIKGGRDGVINKIVFADGRTITATELAKQFNIGNADLKTTSSSDVIHGTVEDDRIFGKGGDDVLYGATGNDFLLGDDIDGAASGNDSIFGDDGIDTLDGGAGDDYLVGGQGSDRILGGAGADTIVFNRGDGQDLITWGPSNAEDSLQLGSGITLQDLEFRRFDHGELEIRIRDSADTITLDQWYSGGVDSKLSNVRFDDGSTFQLSSLAALPVSPTLGTGANDIMTGTQEFNDVFSAGAGDDVLTGKQGNDTLDGGSGKDTLDGNQGNDTLIGGAGIDTYVLSLDMGVDNIIEVAGETSKILLKDNIQATDLSFQLRGNDLFVGLQNVAAETGQGLILKDYVNHPNTWTVVDGAGNQSNLGELKANQQATITTLESASEQVLINHVREQFMARLKNEIYTGWISGGKTVQPGVFESGLEKELAISFSREINGAFIYDDQGFQSGTNGSAERIDFNITGAPNESQFNNFKQRVEVIGQSSNLAQIGRASDWYSYIQTITQVGIDLIAQTAESTHNEYLAQADVLPNPTSDARYIRLETINDETLIRGTLTGIVDQSSSEYLTLKDASKAFFDTGALPEKFLLTRYFVDSTTNIENLSAGASANNIDIDGYAMIDAGAGDDSVNQIDDSVIDRGFSNREFADPYQNAERGAGQFIYGNAGNDQLWGRETSDQLIGGQGNDFLNGRAGADTYYVMPGNQGVDVIYDSGYPFSFDGWDWAYKNWFYEEAGFPNWRELGSSGVLPELPEFPVNDYVALDPIIRAGILARDTVEFAPGISLSDLQFACGRAVVISPDGSTSTMNSLDISWGAGSGIQVVIPTMYDRPGAGIEVFKFADGTTLTMADLLQYVPTNEITGSTEGDYLEGSAFNDHTVGLGGNDALYGDMGDDALDGGDGDDSVNGDRGNDSLFGGAGNDSLYGASGNDLMEGGAGDDVYVWGWGDGQDIIAESDTTVGNVDTLQLYGLLPTDITITRNSNNLYIEINNTDGADKLTLKDIFVSGGEIERIQFADDTIWDMATLVSNAQWETSNHAPTVATPISGQTAPEKQAWVFAVPAETFNNIDTGDQLTYQASLENGDPLPAWLSFDAVTQTFTGNPSNAEVGQISLKLSATDQGGLSVTSSFTLNISNVNDAPSVTAAVTNQSTLEDSVFNYVVPADTFHDIDAGDSLSLSATLADGVALPSWLSFDAASQTFSGTPGNSEVGDLAITLLATDQSGATAATQLVLSVANLNDAPVVSMAVANQIALEDASFRYVIPVDIFADIDAGDTLTLSATLADGTALPRWLNFNPATRSVTGAPGNGQVGSYSIQLTAIDQAGATASTNFNLSVSNVNDAPVVNLLLPDQAVVEYKAFNFVVPANTFADIDAGESTVISATLDDGSALPDWLTFDSDTLTFSGAPTSMDLGVLQVKVTATDQGGLSASDVFDLTVNAAPGQKINGTAGNDTLTGLSGNDTLNGGAGADTMSGGLGNDKYVVDNVGDVVIEQLNEGADAVQSSITYILGANVENLQLTGATTINGTGNELNNILTGNSAANTLTGGDGNDNLNGGLGADTMLGGIGNDNYTVDNVGDIVVENLNEGTDRVKSYISYTLGNNIENLTLLGIAAIDGTGNTVANSLTGNSAANRLAGGDGNDILNGSSGNDTLLGEAGDDTLTGGTGADTLIGGAGNDVYVVADDQDTVTELANEGTDRVNAGISYALGENLENLTLTGTGENNGVGNALDNVLTGNNAKNYLNGLAGNDTVRGNGANDILQGGSGNDTISDNGGQNFLDGGAGTDTLTGNAGNELFIGGQGNDTITTGIGADMIVFNKGDGQDTVKASTGADNTLSLGGGIQYTDLTLSKTGSDLIVGTGTGDSIKLAGWYSITANNKSVVNLQMIAEAMADFDAAGSDAMRDNKIESFNFAGVVDRFDQARGTNTTFSNWAMTNALLDFHIGGSDSAALGGDLAYQYGKNGNLANVSINPAQGILGNTQFGTTAQALQPTANLQDTSPRLG